MLLFVEGPGQDRPLIFRSAALKDWLVSKMNDDEDFIQALKNDVLSLTDTDEAEPAARPTQGEANQELTSF